MQGDLFKLCVRSRSEADDSQLYDTASFRRILKKRVKVLTKKLFKNNEQKNPKIKQSLK